MFASVSSLEFRSNARSTFMVGGVRRSPWRCHPRQRDGRAGRPLFPQQGDHKSHVPDIANAKTPIASQPRHPLGQLEANTLVTAVCRRLVVLRVQPHHGAPQCKKRHRTHPCQGPPCPGPIPRRHQDPGHQERRDDDAPARTSVIQPNQPPTLVWSSLGQASRQQAQAPAEKADQQACQWRTCGRDIRRSGLARRFRGRTTGHKVRGDKPRS